MAWQEGPPPLLPAQRCLAGHAAAQLGWGAGGKTSRHPDSLTQQAALQAHSTVAQYKEAKEGAASRRQCFTWKGLRKGEGPPSCRLLALAQAIVVQGSHRGRGREAPLPAPPVGQAHRCRQGQAVQAAQGCT